MVYRFKNLVFEGGGVKGIAYVGALDILEQKGILSSIIRVGGASAGAIQAVLLALGYNLDEIKSVIWDLNFKNFLDDSWGLVRDSARLIEHYGWYKGDFFRNWIGQLIKTQTGNSESTFADLESKNDNRAFKSLYLMGTNLSTGFSEVFSAEHTPWMCVADAVRISMSIPLFFAAKRSSRGDVYVDGGMLDNYPVKLFDRQKYSGYYRKANYYRPINFALKKQNRAISPYVYNKETLGFRLDTRTEISLFRDQAEPPHHQIDHFFDYAWALVDTFLNYQQNIHLHSDDWARTIYIDTMEVKTTDFEIPDSRKKDLISSGQKGAQEYFEWFDHTRTINQ